MIDKQLKSRLTPEQFEEIKGKVLEERVKEEVDRFVGNFVSVYMPAMRENKISEERAMRIIQDVLERATERFQNGEKGEPRPDDRYLDADTFERQAAEIFAENGVDNPEELANNLYKKLIGGSK